MIKKYITTTELPWVTMWTEFWMKDNDKIINKKEIIHENKKIKETLLWAFNNLNWRLDFFKEKAKATQAFDWMQLRWVSIMINTKYCDDVEERYVDWEVVPEFIWWEHFSTKEDAKSFDKKLQALAYLKKWQAENDNGFIPDWSCSTQEKCSIFCCYDNYFTIEVNINSCSNPFFPYMSSEEVVKKMIKECEKELKIYFWIK